MVSRTARFYVVTKSGRRITAEPFLTDEAGPDVVEWLEAVTVFPVVSATGIDLAPFLTFTDDEGHPVALALEAVESITYRVVGQAAP